MDAAYTSNNQHSEQRRGTAPKCWCGLITLEWQSKKENKNKGRWFWRCPKFGTASHETLCNYFHWQDQLEPLDYPKFPEPAPSVSIDTNQEGRGRSIIQQEAPLLSTSRSTSPPSPSASVTPRTSPSPRISPSITLSPVIAVQSSPLHPPSPLAISDHEYQVIHIKDDDDDDESGNLDTDNILVSLPDRPERPLHRKISVGGARTNSTSTNVDNISRTTTASTIPTPPTSSNPPIVPPIDSISIIPPSVISSSTEILDIPQTHASPFSSTAEVVQLLSNHLYRQDLLAAYQVDALREAKEDLKRAREQIEELEQSADVLQAQNKNLKRQLEQQQEISSEKIDEMRKEIERLKRSRVDEQD